MPAPLYILIAAHNHDIKTVLARLINHTYPWATVGIATNGAEALAMIDRTTPDVLITDHRMPLVDGLTLVRRLRAGQATFPILALSVDRELEAELLTAGATRFLLKPFHPTDLYQALDQMLRRRP